MNKLMQIKLKTQLKEIRKSTESCESFLSAYKDSQITDKDVAAEFEKVVQHQKNMVKFFGLLEQNLSKK